MATTSVKLMEAHGRGPRAGIVWGAEGDALVTAGADSRLLVHKLGGSDEPLAAANMHQKAVTALCLAPGGHTVATASLDRTVKLYSYPGVEFQGNITRFTLPIRSLAFSVTGGLLAAAGDADEIKLIGTVDNSIVRLLKGHETPVVSLAFDPKNDILASADSEGTVIYWSVVSGAKLHTLKHAAPDVNVEEAGKNDIAWHPSGDVLAVPGHQFDVVMYDRETAEVSFRLRGGHNAAVGTLAWSPNGKYLATAGQDRKLMIWDTESKQDLDRQKLVSQIAAISWKPTGNALAVIDVDGKFGVWENPIALHLPAPHDLQQALAALSRQELLKFNDDDVSGKSNSGSDDESSENLKLIGGEEDLEDEDGQDEGDGEEEEEESLPEVKREFKKVNKSSKISESVDKVSHLQKSSSLLRRVKKPRSDRDAREELGNLRQQPCPHKPRPERQAPFQPGSTQQIPGKKRFLTYSLLGCITSCESGGVYHVEVEFHDTSHGHRMPAMMDFNGYTMAALNEKGSVLASPRRGDKTPSTLVYRPFTSWATNSEWSKHFPLTEEVKAVAGGDGWVAAATSLNYLRFFSDAGLQKCVLSLTGPVVTMTSYRQRLVLVTHASDPLESGDQVMEFVIFDVGKQQRLLRGPLPLTPGSRLTWVGFSESGTLSYYDSKGVLRMFSEWYDGSWIPVYSSPAEQDGNENLWIVGLDSEQIYCVKCRAPDLEPQANPKPILSMLTYKMPLVHSDLGADDLENDLSCRSLFLAEACSRSEEAAARGQDDADDEYHLLKMEADLDKCLLRLMVAACQGDKLARALELASMLSLQKSLEGAIKIVTSMHLASLAERLNTLLEERRYSGRSTAARAPQISTETRGSRPTAFALKSSAPVSSPRFATPAKCTASHATLVGSHEANPVAKPSYQANGGSQAVYPLPRSSEKGEKIGAKEKEVEKVRLDASERLSSPHVIANDVADNSPSPAKSSAEIRIPIEPCASESRPAVKSSNPFAKPSSATVSKHDGIPSTSEMSVLDSLKKMQKGAEPDSKKRKKVKSNSAKSQRPSKAAKEVS